MSDESKLTSQGRHNLLNGVAGATASFAGLGINPMIAGRIAKELGKATRPLKAGFSSAGLRATWCARGKQAAEDWGKLFNVDVTWFDGAFNNVTQRAAIDNMASQKFLI